MRNWLRPARRESLLKLHRSTDGGSTWTEVGADARDTAANCVTKNGVTAFSRWALGPGTPTAVTLDHLTARAGSRTGGLVLPGALLGLGAIGLLWRARRTELLRNWLQR